MAWHMAGTPTAPRPDQRTLGDLLAPTRSIRPLDVVNAASRDLGTDVADWSLPRITSLVGQLTREREQSGEG